MIETPTVPAPAATDREVLDAFRRWGYLQADLDPLGRALPYPLPALGLDGPAADEGRRFYCGTLAVEYMHIADPARREWVQERMEADPPAIDRETVLDRLLRAEVFEQTLQAPLHRQQAVLDRGGQRDSSRSSTEMLDACGERRAEQAVLAMSHRGRLNVMAHIVGVPVENLFAGFEDVDPRSTLGGGDVKYHLGATGVFTHRGRHAS